MPSIGTTTRPLQAIDVGCRCVTSDAGARDRLSRQAVPRIPPRAGARIAVRPRREVPFRLTVGRSPISGRGRPARPRGSDVKEAGGNAQPVRVRRARAFDVRREALRSGRRRRALAGGHDRRAPRGALPPERTGARRSPRVVAVARRGGSPFHGHPRQRRRRAARADVHRARARGYRAPAAAARRLPALPRSQDQGLPPRRARGSARPVRRDDVHLVRADRVRRLQGDRRPLRRMARELRDVLSGRGRGTGSRPRLPRRGGRAPAAPHTRARPFQGRQPRALCGAHLLGGDEAQDRLRVVARRPRLQGGTFRRGADRGALGARGAYRAGGLRGRHAP